MKIFSSLAVVMLSNAGPTMLLRYRRENGYDYDAQVIYGDTDSVMIKFGEPELPKVGSGTGGGRKKRWMSLVCATVLTVLLS